MISVFESVSQPDGWLGEFLSALFPGAGEDGFVQDLRVRHNQGNFYAEMEFLGMKFQIQQHSEGGSFSVVGDGYLPLEEAAERVRRQLRGQLKYYAALIDGGPPGR